MKPIRKKYTLSSALKTIFYTVLLNTVIALLISPISDGKLFIANLIHSQCIGLSICGCIMMVLHSKITQRRQMAWMAGAILTGTCLGILMGLNINGFNLGWLFRWQYFKPMFSAFVMAVAFGSFATYIFVSRYQIANTENKIKQERIRRLSMEKEMAETQLKLLQAQIEPHFLFNTLSNVLSLMESDRSKAAAMLTDLTRFLRSALKRTRKQDATLGQELEIIRSYLNVISIRMGRRLTYGMDVPKALLSVPFAPMLLQPLVENAVRHGLEPLIDGGEIHVRAEQHHGTLRVRVSDSGVGIHSRNIDNSGFGLSNIRQRLKTLYGENARLVLEENAASGLNATIEVQLEQN